MAQQHNDNIPYYEIFSIREYVKEGEQNPPGCVSVLASKTG